MVMKSVQTQIETALLELNSGVVTTQEETYHFLVQDENGGHLRTARLVEGRWILQLH